MYPYYSSFRVTSPFGKRIINGKSEFHYGVDLVGEDKRIRSITDGIVIQSRRVYDTTNRTSEWGNYICIHSGDAYIYYCHLSERIAQIGDTVKAGDVIGIEGNTGLSSGSHLHLEVRLYSPSGESVNPCALIGIKGCENEKIETEQCSDFASEACEFAITNNILLGDGNGRYRFKDYITREECVLLLYRLYNLMKKGGD